MNDQAIAKLAQTLSDRKRHSFALDGSHPAAVLVPLFVRDGQMRLLFTRRTETMSSHQGQISFPGGKQDASDHDLSATAKREADEEVGIDPDSVRVIGLLDDVPTPSRFVITPVVGVLEPAPKNYRLSEAEVAEAFEVPLSRLVELQTNTGEITWRGRPYAMWEYQVGDNRIWGATARMVHQLLGLLGTPGAPGPGSAAGLGLRT